MITPAYTTEARVTRLIGTLGLDLRTDDAAEEGTDDDAIQDAVDAGTADLDYYLQRYLAADIASSEWAQLHATYFAVRFLCLRRLNEIPKSLADELARREKQLEEVRTGRADAPRLAATRRPCAVTGYTVDLRRWNRQTRVDPHRTTGAGSDLGRPTDPHSPSGEY